MTGTPKLYLAGPGVFRPDAEGFFASLKADCERAGFVPLSPLDSGPIGAISPDLAGARVIYEANLALLDSVQGVLADMTPFRGSGMDPGTAFEMGYAAARALPVFAWSEDLSIYSERAARDAEGNIRASDGRFVDADGWLVESFSLPDNLMPACCAYQWGGTVYAGRIEALAAARRHFGLGTL